VTIEGGETRVAAAGFGAIQDVIDGRAPLSALIFAGRAFTVPIGDLSYRGVFSEAALILGVLTRPGSLASLLSARLELADLSWRDGMGARTRQNKEFLAHWRSRPDAKALARRILHDWTPSFALVDIQAGEVAVFSDPADKSRVLGLSRFIGDLAGLATRNRAPAQVPTYLVALRSGALEKLKAARLETWLFADMLVGFQDAAILSYNLDAALSDALTIVRNDVVRPGDIVAIKTNLLLEVVAKGDIDWFASQLTSDEATSARTLSISIPGGSAAASDLPAAAPEFASTLLCRLAVRLRGRLGRHYSADYLSDFDVRIAIAEAGDRLSWSLQDHAPIAMRHAGGEATDIVFAVPLFSFGGAERVALRVANELRKLGNHTTLVITDRHEAASYPSIVDAFDEIQFLGSPGDARENLWNHGRNFAQLAAIVQQSDIFIPTHVIDWPALSTVLRDHKVAAIPYLHLSGWHTDGGPVGHPHAARDGLAAADGAIVISDKLASWVTGSGFRRDSVLVARNYASHLFDDAEVAAAVASRARRDRRKPLRVLYIGRLDHEKGLDRLAKIADWVDADVRNAIDLRIVGASVVDSKHLPDSLSRRLMPATFNAHKIADHFAWADVLLMASFTEGVPLVILEAMVFGVVPVTTDVGAIAEIVRHEENGLLVSSNDTDMTQQLIGSLDRLARDRAMVARLAATAAKSGHSHHGWAQSAARIDGFVKTISNRYRRGS
jgi:glycosyltransferase involved in cell wall biosynthesis